jgi:AcrR family transcriptional regulator
MTTPSGWERRRERARERLEAVALEMFVRRGYPNVSVEEIALEAGVSARTFHRYFPSKQDVLLERRERMDQAVIRRIEALTSPRFPARAVRDIFIELVEEAGDALTSFVVWRRAIASAPDVAARASDEGRQRLMVAMRRIFGDWLGVDPSVDVRPDAMSAAVIGVNAVAVERFFESAGKADLPELFVEAFEFLDCGMRQAFRSSPARARRATTQQKASASRAAVPARKSRAQPKATTARKAVTPRKAGAQRKTTTKSGAGSTGR